MKRRRFIATPAALAAVSKLVGSARLSGVAGAAASLGLLANPAAAGGQKTLRYAFPAPESTFDPPSTNSDFYSSTLISQILEAPLTYDYLARPVRLVANTAEHLPEISADGLTITLRIRPGIYFADDVAFKGSPRKTMSTPSSASSTRSTRPATCTSLRARRCRGWPNCANVP